MASAARSLRLPFRGCRGHRYSQVTVLKVFVAWKSVSGGSFKEGPGSETESQKATPFDHWEEEFLKNDRKYANVAPIKVAMDLVSREEREMFAAITAGLPEIGDSEIRKDQERGKDASRLLRLVLKPKREAFWDEDEEDHDLISNDDSEQFDENDMVDVAHAKLEEHREQREYARIAIWEMPLLSSESYLLYEVDGMPQRCKDLAGRDELIWRRARRTGREFAKPFEPPTMDQPLRFRYTSYMGESHPAEKKVVVEFSTADFNLTEVQQMKLKKLAAQRYNPEKDTIKMSCESFEHQAQNKRYLAELVEKLLAEARDPTDTFEDVPLDLRHHKIKVKPKFPKEWRLSRQRVTQLAEYRNRAALIDSARNEAKTLIDGVQVIERANSRQESKQNTPTSFAMGAKEQKGGASSTHRF